MLFFIKTSPSGCFFLILNFFYRGSKLPQYWKKSFHWTGKRIYHIFIHSQWPARTDAYIRFPLSGVFSKSVPMWSPFSSVYGYLYHSSARSMIFIVNLPLEAPIGKSLHWEQGRIITTFRLEMSQLALPEREREKVCVRCMNTCVCVCQSWSHSVLLFNRLKYHDFSPLSFPFLPIPISNGALESKEKKKTDASPQLCTVPGYEKCNSIDSAAAVGLGKVQTKT